MENLQAENKIIVDEFLQFLVTELEAGKFSSSDRKTIILAINCLESVFETSVNTCVSDEEEDDPNSAIVLEYHRRLNTKGVDNDLLKFRILCKAEMPEKDPTKDDLAKYYRYLGNLAFVNDHFRNAEIMYTRAIEDQPSNAANYANRAEAYCRLEENENAINDWKEAIKLDPKNNRLHGRLGFFYYNLENWEEAIKSLEKSLECDPTNQVFQAKLRLTKFKLRESAEASNQYPTENTEFMDHGAGLPIAEENLHFSEEHEDSAFQVNNYLGFDLSDDDWIDLYNLEHM